VRQTLSELSSRTSSQRGEGVADGLTGQRLRPDQAAGESEASPDPTPRDKRPRPPDLPSPRPTKAGTPSRPTSAPRTDAEVQARATEDAPAAVRPGEVVARPGLRIRTVHPRFSLVTRLSVVPRNAVARVTFSQSGEVIEAVLLRSTGSAGYDSPILSSLYRWRAEGEALEGATEPIPLEFRLILMEE